MEGAADVSGESANGREPIERGQLGAGTTNNTGAVS